MKYLAVAGVQNRKEHPSSKLGRRRTPFDVEVLGIR